MAPLDMIRDAGKAFCTEITKTIKDNWDKVHIRARETTIKFYLFLRAFDNQSKPS